MRLAEINAGINLIRPQAGSSFDRSNLQSKVRDYLLNPRNSKNQGFERALGFNRNNWKDLESQIKFNVEKATPTQLTSAGQKYNQTITITGKNGRMIDVEFGFIKDSITGKVRLVTGIPSRK